MDICLAGAQARIGKQREDLPWLETEFDGEFRQWILDLPTRQLPQIYALLAQYRGQKEIVIFKSRQEAGAYLKRPPPPAGGIIPAAGA